MSLPILTISLRPVVELGDNPLNPVTRNQAIPIIYVPEGVSKEKKGFCVDIHHHALSPDVGTCDHCNYCDLHGKPQSVSGKIGDRL